MSSWILIMFFLLQKRVHILFDEITCEISNNFQVFLYATSRNRLLKPRHCDRMVPMGKTWFLPSVFASKFEGTRQFHHDYLKGAIVVDSEAGMRHYYHCTASSNQRLTKQNGSSFFGERYIIKNWKIIMKL